jgi:hypothetical protein
VGWRVQFLELECVRSSEAGGDELYLVVGPVSGPGGGPLERSIFYPDKPSLKRGERIRFRVTGSAAGPIDYRVSDAHQMIVVGLFEADRQATDDLIGYHRIPRDPRLVQGIQTLPFPPPPLVVAGDPRYILRFSVHVGNGEATDDRPAGDDPGGRPTRS